MKRSLVILIPVALSVAIIFAAKQYGGHITNRAPQARGPRLSGAPKNTLSVNKSVPSASPINYANKIKIALNGKSGSELIEAALSIVHHDLKSFTFSEALNILENIDNTTIYWESVKDLIRIKAITAGNCRQILEWTLARGDIPNDVREVAAEVCAYHMSREELEKQDLTTSKSFVAGFFRGLRKRTVAEIELYLDKVNDSPFLAQAYQSLISSCFNSEKCSASAEQLYVWAQKMPPGQDRNDAQAAALYRLAQSNSNDAAARALELFAISDPGAEAAISMVLSSWMEYDELAASNWTKALPPGAARDAAALKLVRSLVHKDPSAAMKWARSIESEKQKQTAMDLLMPESDVGSP